MEDKKYEINWLGLFIKVIVFVVAVLLIIWLISKLTLNKGEYEDILSLAEKYNKRYKMFAYMNLAATTSLSLILFIVMYLILKMNVKTCLLTAIVLFMLDLFMNGKTNQSRYQTKWIRDVNKKVNPNIIKMCNKLFKM